MRWPEIFFKAKSPKLDPETNPPAESEGSLNEEESEALPNQAEDEAIIVQPLPVTEVRLPAAPLHGPNSDSAVIHDMAEADTLRTMTRSGAIRLVKRDFPTPAPASVPSDSLLRSDPSPKNFASDQSFGSEGALPRKQRLPPM